MVDDATIREWARNNGYQVGERGRLQENVKEAYYREFPESRPKTNPNGSCAKCFRADRTHADWCDYYSAPAAPVPEWEEVIPAEEVAPIPAQTAESTPNSAPALNDAVGSLAAALAALTPNVQLDETRVAEIATDIANQVLADSKPPVYEILIGDGPVVTYDKATHARFGDVVKIVGAGLHAYLVGPPGTGKTTLCNQVADALNLNFGAIPCDPMMPTSKLFGFIDASGTYRTTVFRDIYENGGVFLFDEIDNGHPGVLASINGAIANGHCAFPDGMVKRNENFRCIAAANTFGTGATRQFVGRNQLDAATLDRFVTVTVDIDETLEEALTLANLTENVALAKEWLASVRKWRQNVADKGLQVIISPRASIEGARLLGVGFSMAEVAEMKVWKGIDASTRAKIESAF